MYHTALPQALRTELLSRIEALQSRVNKRHDSAPERYKRDYNTKVCSTPSFKPGQIVYIDRPPLAAFSNGSAERLATNRCNNSMPKVVGRFALVSVQPSTLDIDEHGIRNTVSIDRPALAPGNKPSASAFQRLPVEEHLPTDLDTNERKTKAEPTEYAVHQIVAHEGSGNYYRYPDCWYGYSP